MTITQQPSPDWNMVTLKWAATNLDGTPATGTIDVIYNSLQPMLDDDPVTPVSIYPKLLRAPLTTTTIQIWGGAFDADGKPIPGTGDFVAREVGYLELRVPASNDPDIIGSGGTYSFNENLNGVQGRRAVTFVADKDAPGGVIWLNRLPGATPAPAEPYSVVYWDTFYALQQQVDELAANGTGGGVPEGGTAGQALVKLSDTDRDVQWGTVSVPDATTSTPGKVRLASTSADTTRVPLVSLVATMVAALESKILGGAAGAYDTLQELKALLDSGDAADQAAIAALTTVVAGKQNVVRWSGTAWPARPAGAPFGVVFLSTNDPAAPAPPSSGLQVGDVWRKHPDAA